MATIASLNVDLTASTAQFKAALDSASRDLTNLGNKSNSVLQSIKDSFGRGSTFGQIAMLFAGSGAIRGLTMAEREIENMAKRAVELKNELDAGQISAGQFASEFAKSVPILGHIVGLGAEINELITGEQAALKAANDEAKKIEDVRIRERAAIATAKKDYEDLGVTIAKVRGEINLIGASEPEKQFAAAAVKSFDTISAHMTTLAEMRDAILNPKGGPDLSALQKQLADTKKDLESSKTNLPTLDVRQIPSPYGGAVISNQADIDAANAHISDLKKTADLLNNEIQTRQNAAATATAPAKQLIGLDIQKAAKEFAQGGREAAAGFYAAFTADPGREKALKAEEDRLKQLKQGAEEMMKSLETPAQRIQDEMKQLNYYLSGGLLNSKQYAQALAELTERQQKLNNETAKHAAIRAPDTTQRAREFRVTEGIPGGGNNPTRELIDVGKRTVEETKKNNALLDRNNRLLDLMNHSGATSTGNTSDDVDLSGIA